MSDGPGEQISPHAVALDENVAVVGAAWHDSYAGAAYVLRRSGDTWNIEQTLVAPDVGRYDHFGSSVAVDGDYIAVGSPWQNLFRGAVHVFRYDGRSWNLHQTLTASDQDPTGNRALEVVDAIAGRGDPPPEYASAAGDSLEWVTASDGVFEDLVEIKWSPVDLDAIIYKIHRDNVLISVASSQDSVYNDMSGDRGVNYNYCVVVQDMSGGEGTPMCDTGSRIIRAPEHLEASDGQFADSFCASSIRSIRSSIGRQTIASPEPARSAISRRPIRQHPPIPRAPTSNHARTDFAHPGV